MKTKRFGWYTIGIHAVLVVFCILVLLLAHENRALEERLYRASVLAAGGPEIHDILPELAVHELDGGESVLAFDGLTQESVVLVFTTTCPACQKNLEPWLDLHRKFGERYRFIAVGLDSPLETKSFAEQNNLPFRVVTPANRTAFQQAYGIESVPQTLVVGVDGRVMDTHPGVLPRSFKNRLS